MKYLIYLFISLSLGHVTLPIIEKGAPSNEGKLTMLADGKLRYLELEGTPYERGMEHGMLLKDDIKKIIGLFKEDIVKTTGMDADKFIAKFLSMSDYRASVEKLLPDLIEEVKGIAEGSGIAYETIFMHQLGDEYWFNTKDVLAHNCSSFGVNKSANGPSIGAQNMDIPTFYHGFQTVMKIKEGEKEMMFLTIPGHLGITGMNSKAVSINCNTLMQLDYARTGIPVTFVVRGVVSQNSHEEALSFLKSFKHASGQNYMIGGSDKVLSMECSTNKVEEFRPFENSLFTYHTNHPMSNTDYSDKYLVHLKDAGKTVEEGLYKCQRITSFESRFTDKTKMVGVKEIKEVLSSRDHAGGDVVSNNSTYASVIYELGDSPKFIIAPGKPHETEYVEINF
jgi:predicted choloylglycine hydrolase